MRNSTRALSGLLQLRDAHDDLHSRRVSVRIRAITQQSLVTPGHYSSARLNLDPVLSTGRLLVPFCRSEMRARSVDYLVAYSDKSSTPVQLRAIVLVYSSNPPAWSSCRHLHPLSPGLGCPSTLINVLSVNILGRIILRLRKN